MNDVWFEIEKERFLAAKPQFNRILVNPDYIVTTKENYENGIFDFTTEEMQGVYKYLDIIDSYGGKFYINFAFGVSSKIQSWFNISGEKNYAPKDLQLFSNACVALINRLKTQDNGKYADNLIGVSVYNEPNAASFNVQDGADEVAYYNNLINTLAATLNSNGLADMKILGAEISNPLVEKFGNNNYFTNTASNPKLNAASVHQYYSTLTDSGNGISEIVNADYIKKLASKLTESLAKPLYLTEFNTGNYDYSKSGTEVAESEGGAWTWNTSNASMFITCANSGISGASRWNYSCSYWTDPTNYASDTETNYMSLWLNATSLDRVKNGVLDKFYEESLLTNYVKAGSDVLESTADNNDGTRIASFRLPDGNYTVIVEVNEASNRNISISFDKNINKTFYRMSFNHAVKNNGNATVQSCDKVFNNVGDRIFDSVDGNYAYYVYTTCTPIKQVELDKVTATVEAGKTVTFNASLVDCDNEEIVWSVVNTTGTNAGTINNSGVYTADDSAAAGDLVAIKAALNSDPLTYAVAVIEIK